MIGAALRIGFGTASLLAGGWALRALQGTPSALGASPVEIDGIAKSSPNYKDGVFVNLESASPASLTRQEQFLLVREVIGGSSSQHPSAPVPVVTPDPSLAVGRSRRHLVRPFLGGHRDRRLPRDRRSRLERPLLAVAFGRPAPAASGARPAGGAARNRRGHHQPRPLRPPRHRHRQTAGAHPAAPSSLSRSASVLIFGPGTSPLTGSSNSTGTRAPASAT